VEEEVIAGAILAATTEVRAATSARMNNAGGSAQLRPRLARSPTRSHAPVERSKRPGAPEPCGDAVSAQNPVDLDRITAHWRGALDTAKHALEASTAGTSRLDARELSERGLRLAKERDTVGRLLEAVARERHVRLRRPLSAPRATSRMLGLPAGTLACLFDLDGVLTASAEIHAAAWAQTFDEVLLRRAEHAGEGFMYSARPFDPRSDYYAYLHGRPRLDGVREFLSSRGINLPDGRPDDSAAAETAHGLANRKNETLLLLLNREGVAAFEGSRRYLEAARDVGLQCAVVSASANTQEILERAGLATLLDQRVDGDTIRRDHLRPKPAPDTLTAACQLLGVAAESAIAFETTHAGIAAACAAGVRRVVAVDRAGRKIALLAAGADEVVSDLTELLDPSLIT
jgi:beta-phosphoglucomutase family hydrolase